MERFGSTQYMVGWYIEVPILVDLCICYLVLFIIEINAHIYWKLC